MARDKQSAEIIPLDSVKAAESSRKKSADAREFDSTELSSILSWIDMERVVAGDTDQKHARRNALIFQLHYINGLECAEIAGFPGFELTESGVQTILARLRKRIKHER